MPRLSDSMEEGTILKWLKADGDAVARGEPLAEIETDKATLTYESDAAGTLKIVADAGETLPIGSVIATLDGATNGSSTTAQAPAIRAQQETAPAAPAPAPDPPAAAAEPARAAPATDQPPPTSRRVKASPIARRLAREQGVDLQRIAGTGPGGRIVKDDVERAAQSPSPAAAARS